MIIALLISITALLCSVVAVDIPPTTAWFRIMETVGNHAWLEATSQSAGWIVVGNWNAAGSMAWDEFDRAVWGVRSISGEYFKLVNKHTGGYLTTHGMGRPNKIVTDLSYNIDNQYWRLRECPGGDAAYNEKNFVLESKATGRVLVGVFDGYGNVASFEYYFPTIQGTDREFYFDFKVDYSTCKAVAFAWDEANGAIWPKTAEVYRTSYTNNGPIQQSITDQFEVAKCVTNTVETSQETHWDVGVEASAGFSFFGADVSVTASASTGGSSTTSNSKETTECSTVSAQPPVCPGYYKCDRVFTISKLSGTKRIRVTLDCAGVELIWKGTMRVEGGAEITYIDQFAPMDCFDYYSDSYSDRNGKLPFCTSCTNQNICNTCAAGSAAPLLLHINQEKVECISNFACVNYCGGTLDDSVATQLFCGNADVALTGCQWHLGTSNVYDDARSNFMGIENNDKWKVIPAEYNHNTINEVVIVAVSVVLTCILIYMVVWCVKRKKYEILDDINESELDNIN